MIHSEQVDKTLAQMPQVKNALDASLPPYQAVLKAAREAGISKGNKASLIDETDKFLEGHIYRVGRKTPEFTSYAVKLTTHLGLDTVEALKNVTPFGRLNRVIKPLYKGVRPFSPLRQRPGLY